MIHANRSGVVQKLKLTMTVLAVSLLTLMWQNCSDVSFSQKSAKLTKLGDGSADQNNQSDGNTSDSDSDSDYEPDEDDDGEVDENWLRGNCLNPSGNVEQVSSSATDRTVINARGILIVLEALSLKIENFRGIAFVRKALSSSILNTRGPLLLNSNEVVQFKNTRGPVCLSSHQVNHINDHRGPLWFSGLKKDGVKAEIGIVENFRGPLILKNVNVGKVLNARGPIFVTNGSIGTLENVRGPVFVDGVLVP